MSAVPDHIDGDIKSDVDVLTITQCLIAYPNDPRNKQRKEYDSISRLHAKSPASPAIFTRLFDGIQRKIHNKYMDRNEDILVVNYEFDGNCYYNRMTNNRIIISDDNTSWPTKEMKEYIYTCLSIFYLHEGIKTYDSHDESKKFLDSILTCIPTHILDDYFTVKYGIIPGTMTLRKLIDDVGTC